MKKKKTILFFAVGLFLLLLFFLYGFIFDIWGKPFKQLPLYVNVTGIAFLPIFIFYIIWSVKLDKKYKIFQKKK